MNVSANSKQPILVAIGDSNPLMLSALSDVFERDKRFSLVATTATAEGFLETVLRIPVDVGIIDWALPRLGAEKLLDVLRAHGHAPRVLIYAQTQGAELPRRAMAAGAAGFCARSEPPETLLDFATDIAVGRMVFPFLDIRDLRHDPIDSLTKRERILLEAVAQGQTNKAMAAQFNISVNTVKFHLRNLFEKLSVNNRAQAVAFYYSSLAGQPLHFARDGDDGNDEN